MKILRTLKFLLIWALANLLTNTNGTASLQAVLTGPDMAFLRSRVTFRCVAPSAAPPVTFELVKDGEDVVDGGRVSLRNESVAFSLKVTASTEGSYHCTATASAPAGGSGRSNSIQLSVVTPPQNTRVTSEPFPPVAYEGSRFSLGCSVAAGSHLSYTWFFNRTEVKPSALFRPRGNELVMDKVSPQHAGYYSCMAWSMVQDTKRYSSSMAVQLTVKVYVSKPRISLSITKEGSGYLGKVACWSSQGTLPVNFSLLLDNRQAGSITSTESLAAWFPVPIVLGRDMGVVRCHVANEVQELTSEPLTLVVVPVGGEVMVDVEYLYGADSELAAARLRCRLSRGTFPHVSWFFNDDPLPPEVHEDAHNHSRPASSSMYATADQSRTLFLTQLGPKESGYYRCKVRDNYDAAGAWVESAAVLVQVTDTVIPAATPETAPKVPLTTIEILSITFCCFLLLLLAVGMCCIYRMFDHKRARSYVAPYQSDAHPLSRPARQSAHRENYSFSTESDPHNQTEEVTV
ncbi:hemicentin-2 isoform X3 [Nelusetta ayraudi]|uniref:hemicentin-2 isoform X3 n=1 Tax=Nelusetta ayraudi TaxID=303726 RepID=UPI003F71ED84